MTDLLLYQGKAALALVAFYIFYRLLLSKETFHRFNRIVLLGTAAMAFVLPLCVITISKTVILPAVSPVETVVETVEEVITATASVPQEPIWPTILLGIIVVGALVVMSMTVISIFKVMSIIRSGEHQTLDSGETLVITENGTAPFSWMKYIVLSREDYESGYSQILTHEKAHIALRHSWDLLFVDLITVLQWFNPVIWMLKSDLRALHEFEADDAVLRSGANIKEYQYLLIKKAVSKSGYSVANSFNHSTLKARITMMLNKKSSRMSAWKALYVLPLVGISLAATAETKVDYQYEGQQPDAVVDTPVDKDSKKIFKEKNMSEGRFIIDEEAGSITMIYFDHNGNEMRATHVGLNLDWDLYFVNGNMATTKAFEMRMEEDGAVLLSAYLKNGKTIRGAVLPNNNYTTGTWDVSKHPDEQDAVYHKDGKAYKIQGGKYVEIEVPKIKVRDANGNDVEVSQSNLVYVINGERMPKGFDLNTIDPKTIASIDVLKTEKALQEYGTDEGVIVITTGEPKKNADSKKAVPFQLVAQKPGFNGGDANEFSKYVAQNVVYPESCRQSKIEGRVTLEFTVTETGKVGDIRILRSVNSDLDREAVRVVAQSPIWTPGRDENGEVVPVKYTFPVIFKLPDSDDSSHYLEADVKPTFNGGDANEFAKWVYSQLKYPEECMKAGISGRISLSFIVDTDGKVRDVKVLRGAHEKLDAEAVRVLEMSPDWTPGLKDGKPVPVTFTFPVNFEIPDSENK